jgi:hypothetical protein
MNELHLQQASERTVILRVSFVTRGKSGVAKKTLTRTLLEADGVNVETKKIMLRWERSWRGLELHVRINSTPTKFLHSGLKLVTRTNALEPRHVNSAVDARKAELKASRVEPEIEDIHLFVDSRRGNIAASFGVVSGDYVEVNLGDALETDGGRERRQVLCVPG